MTAVQDEVVHFTPHNYPLGGRGIENLHLIDGETESGRRKLGLEPNLSHQSPCLFLSMLLASLLHVVSIRHCEAPSNTRPKKASNNGVNSDTLITRGRDGHKNFVLEWRTKRALKGVFCSWVFIFKTCYCLANDNGFLCSVFIKSSNRLLLCWPEASTPAHHSLF